MNCGRFATAFLLLRSFDVAVGARLIIVAGVVHVLVGRSPLELPGTVGAAGVNGAMIGGLLAGAAIPFGIRSSTPWHIWRTRTPAAVAQLLVLAVLTLILVAVGSAVQVLTDTSCLAGWLTSGALCTTATTLLRSPVLACALALVFIVSIVVLAPDAPDPLLQGLMAPFWYGFTYGRPGSWTLAWVTGAAGVLSTLSLPGSGRNGS